MPTPYRQYRDDVGLYIERYTPRVPQDGKWYVILKDEIAGAYRSLKAAQERYRALLQEMNYNPASSEPSSSIDLAEALRREAQDEFIARHQVYWATTSGKTSGGRFANRRKR
jgi:hypothetical protein